MCACVNVYVHVCTVCVRVHICAYMCACVCRWIEKEKREMHTEIHRERDINSAYRTTEFMNNSKFQHDLQKSPRRTRDPQIISVLNITIFSSPDYFSKNTMSTKSIKSPLDY